jgi:hypothetical protein
MKCDMTRWLRMLFTDCTFNEAKPFRDPCQVLDMPSISDVPATEQQQGEEVIIEEGGRGSTRHIVPSLRYPYPGPEHEGDETYAGYLVQFFLLAKNGDSVRTSLLLGL